MGLAVASNLFWAAVLSVTFPRMLAVMGSLGAFAFYAWVTSHSSSNDITCFPNGYTAALIYWLLSWSFFSCQRPSCTLSKNSTMSVGLTRLPPWSNRLLLMQSVSRQRVSPVTSSLKPSRIWRSIAFIQKADALGEILFMKSLLTAGPRTPLASKMVVAVWVANNRLRIICRPKCPLTRGVLRYIGAGYWHVAYEFMVLHWWFMAWKSTGSIKYFTFSFDGWNFVANFFGFPVQSFAPQFMF